MMAGTTTDCQGLGRAGKQGRPLSSDEKNTKDRMYVVGDKSVCVRMLGRGGDSNASYKLNQLIII